MSCLSPEHSAKCSYEVLTRHYWYITSRGSSQVTIINNMVQWSLNIALFPGSIALTELLPSRATQWRGFRPIHGNVKPPSGQK